MFCVFFLRSLPLSIPTWPFCLIRFRSKSCASDSSVDCLHPSSSNKLFPFEDNQSCIIPTVSSVTHSTSIPLFPPVCPIPIYLPVSPTPYPLPPPLCCFYSPTSSQEKTKKRAAETSDEDAGSPTSEKKKKKKKKIKVEAEA